MKKKKSDKKLKPIIFEKRSKKFKSEETPDYENDISKILHEMKLDNTSYDSIDAAKKMNPQEFTFTFSVGSESVKNEFENYSYHKTRAMKIFSKHTNYKMNINHDDANCDNDTFPPNTSKSDSSKRKKCLESSSQSNSSYISGIFSNNYKQPETKCMCFIPFKEYIQGNISDFPKRRMLSTVQKNEKNFQQMTDIKIQKKSTPFNFSNVTQKYEVFEEGDVCCTLNKYIGWFGEITQKSKLNMTSKIKKSSSFQMISVFKPRYHTEIKNLTVDHSKKPNSVIFKGSFQRYVKGNTVKDSLSCMFMNIIQFSVIIPKTEHNPLSITKDLKCKFLHCFENTTSLVPDIRSIRCYIPRGLISKEELTEYSPIRDLDTKSKISKTIIDLLWLELKIKKLNSFLTKFGIKSNAYDEFKKLRLKSAMLIKTYKIIMDKRSKSDSRKRKRDKKETVKKDAAFKHVPTKEKNRNLNIKANVSNAAHKDNRNETHKPKRKYKRKFRNQSSEEPCPKRSKLLDDCIMRANITKKLSLQRTNEGLVQGKTFQSFGDCTSYDVSCENEVNIQNENDFTLKENVVKLESVPVDPIDIEICQILSQLPPIESLSNDTEAFTNTSIPPPTTDTVHIDCGNGKFMVVLPYVTS